MKASETLGRSSEVCGGGIFVASVLSPGVSLATRCILSLETHEGETTSSGGLCNLHSGSLALSGSVRKNF